MVKVWTHKPGASEPFLAVELSLETCARQFDLEDADFLQPLGAHPLTKASPGPLGADSDQSLVVFEVLADEQTTQLKPGYYASHMKADTIQELLAEE